MTAGFKYTYIKLRGGVWQLDLHKPILNWGVGYGSWIYSYIISYLRSYP